MRDALTEAERAEEAIDDIPSSASLVISSEADIAAQLREQSSTSREISHNVSAIAASSAQVSDTVDAMAGIAKHLESLAATLQQSVKRCQIA